MKNTQPTTNNDETQTSITNKIAKVATFLGSAKLGEHVLENNTLDRVANYIQQIAVDVSSSIDPMTAIYVAGPMEIIYQT